jgi:hypothetical protein
VPAPFASPQDFADFVTPDVDTSNAALLLAYASALIRAATPHTDMRVALYATDPSIPGALDPMIPRMVCIQVVKRYLTNPTGASAQTIGPYSVSYVDRYEGTDGSANIRGGLQLTKSDLAALRPYSPRTKVGSIRLAAALGPQRTAGGWVVEAAELERLAGYPVEGAVSPYGP